MLGLESLDVLIGLVTVYLVFGIVCTAIVEAIASHCSFRSRNLETALKELLSGNLKPNLSLVDAFYAHPLIQSLSKGNNGRPSYIPAETVGKVIYSLLVDNDSANTLTKAISELPDFGAKTIRSDDLEARLRALQLGLNASLDDFTKRFFDHASIKALRKTPQDKPTLIPVELVGKVVYSLLDTLPDKGNALKLWLPAPGDEAEFITVFNSKVPLGNSIKSLLTSLIVETKDNVEDFRKAVETQFDSAMDRASGWFKRKQQCWTLTITALVVIACNVDTLAITHALSINPEVRVKLVAIAEQTLEESKKAQAADAESKIAKNDADKSAADEVKNKAKAADDAPQKAKEKSEAATKSLAEANTTLKAAGLPLGWPENRCMFWQNNCKLLDTWENIRLITGLLVSILAISLGAPFWFDVLQRFMQIRGTGPSPAESKEKKKS